MTGISPDHYICQPAPPFDVLMNPLCFSEGAVPRAVKGLRNRHTTPFRRFDLAS